MTATRVHRRQWEAIERYDWELMRSLYHPEYVYTDNTGTRYAETDTPVAVMRHLHTAFPDVELERCEPVAAAVHARADRALESPMRRAAVTAHLRVP
ncbi:nuclear transport factor 2 family protein [Streptomyces sp. NPDC001292]|uniref:nuclear transport factor 2 family protein n=1 Tax=Streptomyces sp. NPDC001292 TaxID=3364558 RepID=UPI00367C40E2